MAIHRFIDNPFVLGYDIPDRYFCDREAELEHLLSLLENGNNIVLMSERRIGKSSLLFHLLRNKRLQSNFVSFYVDIFKTENAAQFALVFCDAIRKGGYDLPKSFSDKVNNLFSRFQLTAGVDAFDKPNFGLQFSGNVSSKAAADTVEEFLELLKSTGKQMIVVIDEFQQIKDYPEKRFDALLRTHIQSMNNVRFIFSGSERRMLSHMFNTSTEPFYRSSIGFELGKIPKEKYIAFAERMFSESNKRVDLNSLSDLYDLFAGFTSYMNQVLNRAFSITPTDMLCDRHTIEKSLSDCIVGYDNSFHDSYFRMSAQSRAFLVGLSVRRGVLHVTGKDFTESFCLSSSQAHDAAISLQGKGMSNRFVYREPRTGIYYLDDKFFEIWIRAKTGISISQQLNEACKFVRRDPRENLRRDFPSSYALSDKQNTELRKQGYLSEPFVFTDVDMSEVSYVVQRDSAGNTISLPVSDCLALLGGVDAVTVNKKMIPLSDEDKEILASGKNLDVDGIRFRFDLKSFSVRRKYVRRNSKSASPE